MPNPFEGPRRDSSTGAEPAKMIKNFNLKERLRAKPRPAVVGAKAEIPEVTGPVTREEIDNWGTISHESGETAGQTAVIERLEKFRSPLQAERQEKRKRLFERCRQKIIAAKTQGPLKFEDLFDQEAEKDTYPLLDDGHEERERAYASMDFEDLASGFDVEYRQSDLGKKVDRMGRNFVKRQLDAEKLIEDEVASEAAKEVAQALMNRLELISANYADLDNTEQSKAYAEFIVDLALLDQCLVRPYAVSKLLEIQHGESFKYLKYAFRSYIQNTSFYYRHNASDVHSEGSEMQRFLNGRGGNVYYLDDGGFSRIGLHSGRRNVFEVTFNSLTNVFAAWNVYGFPRMQKTYDQ